LSSLPPWLSRWFGYRTSPVPPKPKYIIWIWSFIGSFGGLAIVQIMFTRSSYFFDKGVPSLIASYGASAVLIYGVLDGPFAQPRALIGRHVLSAILSTAISKLFLLLPPDRFVPLQFLVSSLSTETVIILMQTTGTSHPPAGATVLNPILDD
ncbi:HPP family-domain-containing protein, partial [Coprinopsis sp. MPI-PUGE-AT-0042]